MVDAGVGGIDLAKMARLQAAVKPGERALSQDDLLGWARHSVNFFAPAKSCTVGLTYRQWDGSPVLGEDGLPREDRFIVATSRMAYGLSKMAAMLPARHPDIEFFAERAQLYVDFIIDHMVRSDGDGMYFVRAGNGNGEVLDPATGKVATGTGDLILNVEQQAYGLSGLVAFYALRPSAALAAKIDKLYSAFYRRFHDDRHGGFFDRFDRKTRAPVRDESLGITPKSFNSTAYVASAFLYELAQSDIRPQGIPAPRDTLIKLGRLVAKHFPDATTGWIVENFSEDWRPVWHGWQKHEKGTLSSVGHNFQAAWLLLQIAQLGDSDLIAPARAILHSMLNKPGIDWVYGGFNNVYMRETDQVMWPSNDPEGPNSMQSVKHWWQQVFGILSLTLAENMGALERSDLEKAKEARNRALAFYERNFIDPVHGGEFFGVKRDGTPIYSGDESLKGAPGKSTHHSLQLAWYMSQYLRVAQEVERVIKVGPHTAGVERLPTTNSHESPYPIGSDAWRRWYYEPPDEVNWYPGRHISGYYGGSPRRSEYPEIFGYPPGEQPSKP